MLPEMNKFSDYLASWEVKRSRWVDLSIFLAWLATVCFLIFHHVMWRDEVRALSIALGGNNLVEMLKGLHGEGHPALWYLLLRAANSIVTGPTALPLVAFVVALAATSLLIFRSPFPPLVTAGLAFSKLLCFEYSVMARNYGISVLILFLIAEAYPKQRGKGVVVGVLLFLLANTNVIGTLMAGAFLLFWLIDILDATGMRWTGKLRNFVLNAIITGAGVAVCALTILPTFNDAATQDWSTASPAWSAAKALFNPGGTSLLALAGRNLNLPTAIVSALLFLVVLGLLPNRAAFISALFGLLVASLFFSLAADGGERHAGVWFFFCISLYWIVWNDITKVLTSDFKNRLVRLSTVVGCAGVFVLVGIQDIKGVITVGRLFVDEDLVASRSYDFGRLVASRPELSNAILIADPDYMVEAARYYAPNRTYLFRSQQFGSFVKFSRSGKLNASLGELLDRSRMLKEELGVPVIILLSHKLDELIPDKSYIEGYNWTFTASAAQIQEFRTKTTLLRAFRRAQTDESYEVYLLK